jgi:hypothetical protein
VETKMLQKAIEFFEMEYKEELKLQDSKPDWYNPKICVQLTIHRCLGVAQFVQSCGVIYEEITPRYDEIREKLEKLLDN